MTDPERDHLLGRIAGLERRLRRWRLACLVLLTLLVLPVVLGGLLGVWWVPRLEREKAARLQREQARRDSYERLVQEARHEAERQRAVSEEEVRRLREQQGLGKRKE